MATDAEYRERIRSYSVEGLQALWDVISQGDDVEGWQPGKVFEFLVLRAFELEEAEVSWPYSVRIEDQELEQIDGAIHIGGLSFLAESKDYARPLAIAPIAKLRNQLMRRPGGVVGVVFSRTGFTSAAETLARFSAPQSVLLWHGAEIEYGLRHRHMVPGLLAKYRYCVEYGLPNYNIRLLEIDDD